MTYDVDDMAVQIHKTARDHGFWDKDRNFGEMLMLVASELAEALEEDRNGMPRIYWKCRSCGWYTHDEPQGDYEGHYIPTRSSVMKDLLRWLGRGGSGHGAPCLSTEPLKPEGTLVEIADAIIRLFDTGQHEANKTKWSLGQVMNLKMDYNEQREAMHGKRY